MRINEIVDNAEIALQKIKQNCQPFLKESSGWPIFRDMKKSDNFLRLKVRKDRQPRDSTLEFHKKVDSILKSLGYADRTSSVFVTGDPLIAGSYGTIFVVFPIGDFDFSWNTVYSDLWYDQSQIAHFKETFSNKNLSKAIQSKHEIQIRCDEYYAVKLKYFLENNLHKILLSKESQNDLVKRLCSSNLSKQYCNLITANYRSYVEDNINFFFNKLEEKVKQHSFGMSGNIVRDLNWVVGKDIFNVNDTIKLSTAYVTYICNKYAITLDELVDKALKSNDDVAFLVRYGIMDKYLPIQQQNKLFRGLL